MFVQRCFIRKNNEELINKVLTFGNRTTKFINKDYDIIIATPKIVMCGDTSCKDDEYVVGLGYIDCGTNENLFLALAALQDDTDNEQWFVYQDGSFLKCECDSKIDMWGDFEYPEIYLRKATVEELIKYFK